jgi:hypothetical protein
LLEKETAREWTRRRTANEAGSTLHAREHRSAADRYQNFSRSLAGFAGVLG